MHFSTDKSVRRLVFSLALGTGLGLLAGCTTAVVTAPASHPPAVMHAALEGVFGPPSSKGFGSAVFSESVGRSGDLELVAQHCYQKFLGKLWRDSDGAATWMAVWRLVYERDPAGRRDIVAELRGIADARVRSSIEGLIEGHQNPDAASAALSSAYDGAAIEKLAVYAVGDGAALSGVVIAGRAQSGAASFLVFLMD